MEILVEFCFVFFFFHSKVTPSSELTTIYNVLNYFFVNCQIILKYVSYLLIGLSCSKD